MSLVKTKRGAALHSEIQHLLDQSKEVEVIPVRYTIPISKKFSDEGKFIVAGYASVEVVDSQNELIPIPTLKNAWSKFIENEDFARINLMHSNIPIGKVLREYTDSKGHVWKSGVDDQGLFVVSEIREDIKKGRETKKLIQDDRLTGYSIAGEALATSIVKDTKPYTRIDELELHEISCVDRPANEPSVFTIVKRKKRTSEELGLNLLNKMLIIPMMRLEKAYVEKKVERRGNEWCVVHCTGPDAGKAIKCFPTKKEADDMHAAIMTNKFKLNPDRRGTKERLMAHYGLSEEEAVKLIDDLGEDGAKKLLPERGSGLDKADGRPPKAWWDKCMSRAEGIPSINNSAAFCGNLYHNGPANQREAFGKSERPFSTENVFKEVSIGKLDEALSRFTRNVGK